MKRSLFAATLLSLAVASPGHAKEEPVSFTYDGIAYTYTVTELGENRRVIEGRAKPGSHFRLVVAGGRVFGTANDAPVSFRVKDTVALSDTRLKMASR